MSWDGLGKKKERTVDTLCRDLKGILLSEKSPFPKVTGCVIPLLCHSQHANIVEMGNRLEGVRG